MATGERISFWNDESGATYLEFTISMMTFFVILFGIIEFTYIFYQWNAATKAVQYGARLAAVSNPVALNLRSMTTVDSTHPAGGAMPAFDITCSGASASCSGTGGYDADAMKVIVYGRNADGTSKAACDVTATKTSFLQNGMCDFLNTITIQNVQIRYDYTGLGYAGRPGGPVPTITVSLTGLSYNFVFLNALFGFVSVPVPALSTTVTGEDLNQAGS